MSNSHAPEWKRLFERAGQYASAIRRRFDNPPLRATPAAIVIGLGALAIGVGKGIERWTLGDCPDLPVDPIRLQATFDARQFAALVLSEGTTCRQAIPWVFFADILFSLVYPFALAALFMWVERWRRYDLSGTPTQRPIRPRHHFLVLAPFVAGALDIFPEDVLLGVAATGAIPALNGAFVWIGSVGAVLKWVILLLFAWGVCAELLAGPRGVVLRMLRFSVLGAVLGSVPLLLIPQGQDILQRLVEGDHYVVTATFGIVAIVFVALAIWYCGRTLIQLHFADVAASGSTDKVDDWYRHFAEYAPRALGTAAILVSAAALAKAGMAEKPLTVAVILGLLVIVSERSRRAFQVRRNAKLGREDAPDDLWSDFRRRRNSVIAAALISAGVMFGWGWLRDMEDGLRRLSIASGFCLAAAWLFYLWVQFRRLLKDRTLSAEDRTGRALGENAPHLSRIGRWSWAAALLSAIILVVFTARPVEAGRFLGPLWVLALATGNAVFVGSLIVRFGTRYEFPLVRVMLMLALIFSIWNDNHLVRTTVDDAVDAAQAHADSGIVRSRLTLDTQYARWRIAGGPSAGPVILVAASGGGLRAAYWTAAALAAVQDTHPTFSRHVFALSSVSGGSLGAALFAALVHDGDTLLAGIPCAQEPLAQARTRSDAMAGPYTRCVRDIMRDDFLSPVLAKMVAPDLLQRFLPVTFKAFDRSTALEESWEASYRRAAGRPTLRLGLAALSADSASASRPTLFLNSTHVESGRRYIASPVMFDGRIGDAGDMLRAAGADLPLSVAVHNSARFTFVSPAGRLSVTDTLGRVVDGGYFENSGLATLQEIARAIRASDASRRVVVLYLCNDPVPCANEIKSHPDSLMSRDRSTWANELLAPVRAVLHARDARGALARTQVQRDTANVFLQLNVCDRIVDATRVSADSAQVLERGRERVVSPPLGWLLSRLAREWMDASIDRVGKPDDAACRLNNLRVLAALGSLLSSPAAGAAPGR